MVTVLPAKSASWALAGAGAAIARIAKVIISRIVILVLSEAPSACLRASHGGRSGNHRKPLASSDLTPRQAIAPAAVCGSIVDTIHKVPATGRRGDGDTRMFGKLNHLAITTDHYTTLGMFYRAVFGMTVSGDTSREMSAISVGDGYTGMTLIPRRGGRKAGLDHFGIEVQDLEKVRGKVAKKYSDIEIVKRPGNRPFASYSAHDPAGNYFDLSQPGHENRAEVYAKNEWKQDTSFSHFALRARDAQRVADFYVDVFELHARNAPTEEGGYHLTDGRVTLAVLPWKISSFNGAGIEQPGMDHIGFRVPALAAFKAHVDKVAKTNIQLAPKPIDFDSEGAARLALLRRCPHGSFQLADPDGTLIDVG